MLVIESCPHLRMREQRQGGHLSGTLHSTGLAHAHAKAWPLLLAATPATISLHHVRAAFDRVRTTFSRVWASVTS